MLCKGTSLRMRLTVGVRSVLRNERLATDYVGGFLLCLRVRRGFGVTDLLFPNQCLMLFLYYMGVFCNTFKGNL